MQKFFYFSRLYFFDNLNFKFKQNFNSLLILALFINMS